MTDTLTTGELFAGVGGLGMAVDAVFGSRPVWFSEFDEAPSKVLEFHYPGIPNYGDVTPGVPRGGGLSGPRRRDRDGVSHRAMVSENDQELTQKDDTARWLLTSLPSSSCSGN